MNDSYVPFAERASWSRRAFDLAVGTAFDRLSVALYGAASGIDRLVGRLAEAGWLR